MNDDRFQDEKLEAEKRKLRMDDAASRIMRTDSGQRFLDRMRDIGKPKPLRSDPDDEGE